MMQEKVMRLRDYVKVLFERKRLIVIGSLISVVAAALVSLFLPNIYLGRATLVIANPTIKTQFAPSHISVDLSQVSQEIGELSKFGTSSRYRWTSTKTCQTLLKSQDLLKEIIDTLKLKRITVEDLDEGILTTEIVETVKTYQTVKYAPLINLVVRIDDKRLAQDIANTWADLAAKKINMVTTTQIDGPYQFITKEFKDSKEKLFMQEAALKDFKKHFRLPILETKLEDKKKRLNGFQEDLQEIQRSKKLAGAASLDSDLLSKEKSLKDAIAGKEKEIGTVLGVIYDKELELARLKRDIRDSTMRYNLFLQKLEEVKIAREENMTVVMVAARATEPEKNIAPNRARIIFVAGILGFAMMTLAAFIIEVSNKV